MERRDLLATYQRDNPQLCASVDEYGFNGDSLCTDIDFLRVELDEGDEPRLIAMVREFLWRNRAFTNVYDTTGLQVMRSQPLRGCLKCDGSSGDLVPISWIFTFEEQTYEGLQVKGSLMRVFADSEKVFLVYGHWMAAIAVPHQDRLDHAAARATLVGREITYYHYDEHNYLITEESFGDYRDKVIYPLETSRGLEFRVCHVVAVGDIWHVYVDTTTGEVVAEEQYVILD